MPGLSTSPAAGRGKGVPAVAIVVASVAVAGGLGFWWLERQAARPPAGPPVLTAEAKAYTRFLKLSGVGMRATQSYLGQTLVEIEGKITNAGVRSLRLVEVNCVFYDRYGQVVLRQRVPIVRNRTAAFKPGETRDFVLPFDELPESWNQGPPQLVIARIIFE